MTARLEIDQATVTYRQPGRRVLTAVDGVSLTLGAGEVLGLVGESGCGKSTLARAVCGLEPLASGAIRFDGEPVRRLGLRPREMRQRRIQMVFQNPYASLNPRRRVGVQIEDARRIAGSAALSVEALLEQVGLEPAVASRYPYEFSGGQRQRIAIARAMAAAPERADRRRADRVARREPAGADRDADARRRPAAGRVAAVHQPRPVGGRG